MSRLPPAPTLRLGRPVNGMPHDNDPTSRRSSERDAEVRRVVHDCIRRRAAGEELLDEAVIGAHARLMPELADELRRLRQVEHAQQLAESSADATSRELGVRCPNCHDWRPIDDDTLLSGVECSTCGSSFHLIDETDDADMPVRERVGQFRLLERVGSGAFGSVWRAEDSELQRIVAIKIPRQGQLNAERAERFVREAQAAAQLAHPNIVRVHEVGREEGLAYLVTDFVEGETLAEVLASGPMTPGEAAKICVAIAEALDHAHERGVVHRDLKPSNVMLDAAGQPHLMDFGLAKRDAAESTLTLDGKLLGTPAYMSPEQARGTPHDADRRSDVYSLGVILYELLTGEQPFRGSTRLVVHQVLLEEPRSPRSLNSSLPRDLETVCLKCLEKAPKQRYQTANEFADDLRRFLAGEPVRARAVTRLDRAWRWCRRNTLAAGLATAAVGLLLILAVGGPIVAINRAALARSEADAREDANTARKRASDEAELRRRQLYRSDMIAAQHAWDDNNVDHVLELLLRHIPEAGQEDLRRFEWYLLWRLCEPSLFTPSIEHDAPVLAVAFSPDGSLLATAPMGSIVLWDATTRQELIAFETGLHTIQEIAFSPYGSLLAVVSREAFELWHLNAEREANPSRIAGPFPSGNAVAFSPDGKLVAVESYHDGDVWLWDVDKHQWREPLLGPQTAIRCLQFLPDDSSTLAVTGLDDTLWLFDVPSGRHSVLGVHHPSDGLHVVAFSRDGRTAASAGRDNVIKLWDVETRTWIADLRGQADTISDAAFSPDGRTLASCGMDGTVMIWDIDQSRAETTLKGHSSSIWDLAYSPDGKTLATASADGRVRLWNMSLPAQALPDDTILATAGADGNVKLWSTSHPAPAIVTGIKVAFCSDNATLITTAEKMIANVGWTSTVTIRRAATLEPMSSFSRPGRRYCAASPSGDFVATGTPDGTIEIWDIATGEKQKLPDQLDDLPTFFKFSPGGQILAAASGTTLRLWDLGTFRRLSDFDVYRAPHWTLYPVAFYPGSGTPHLAIATVGKKNTETVLKLWDLHGTELRTIGYVHVPVHTLAFSFDGAMLAAGGFDGAITIWDVEACRQIGKTLYGHTDTIFGLAFSPDGTRLASGADETLRLWNPESGENVLAINFEKHVRSVAFSADGRTLAANSGAEVRFWRAAIEEQVQATIRNSRMTTGD